MFHAVAGDGSLHILRMLQVPQEQRLSAFKSGLEFRILGAGSQDTRYGVCDKLVVGDFVIDVKLIEGFAVESVQLLGDLVGLRYQAFACIAILGCNTKLAC